METVTVPESVWKRRQEEDAETFGEHARRLEALDGGQRINRDRLNQHQARLDGLFDRINILADQIDALKARLNRTAERATLRLAGADYMAEQYDPENDAAQVSYWDMQLLGMIKIVNDRLSSLEVHDGTA